MCALVRLEILVGATLRGGTRCHKKRSPSHCYYSQPRSSACARFDMPGVEDTGALYLRTSVVSRNVVRWYRYIHVVAGLETSVSRVNLEIDIAWFSGGPYRISAPLNSIRGRVTSTSSLFAA